MKDKPDLEALQQTIEEFGVLGKHYANSLIDYIKKLEKDIALFVETLKMITTRIDEGETAFNSGPEPLTTIRLTGDDLTQVGIALLPYGIPEPKNTRLKEKIKLMMPQIVMNSQKKTVSLWPKETMKEIREMSDDVVDPKALPLKSYTERCLEKEAARQKECGWGSGAWVGVCFAEPKTPGETKALKMVQEKFPSSVTVSVQSIVEWLAESLDSQ